MRVSVRAGTLSHRQPEGEIETDFDHPRWGGKPLNVAFVGGLQLVGSGALMALVYKMGSAKLMGYGALAGGAVGVGLGGLELWEGMAKRELVVRQIQSDDVASWRGRAKAVAWKTLDVGYKALLTAFLVGTSKSVGSVVVPFLSCAGAASLFSGAALVAVRSKSRVERYATETERESGRFSYCLREAANFRRHFWKEEEA